MICSKHVNDNNIDDDNADANTNDNGMTMTKTMTMMMMMIMMMKMMMMTMLMMMMMIMMFPLLNPMSHIPIYTGFCSMVKRIVEFPYVGIFVLVLTSFYDKEGFYDIFC